MSSYASQLHEEQQAVDRAYGRLDDLRAEMWQRLDTVRAAGSHGSPTQRSERDSFATMYENRLTQLRSVEDRLVFGRLDAKNGDRHYIGRIGLSSPDHEPILTDWRAEAARPFYEATPSNHGDIVMRRHITLSFREVVGVEDEVLDVHSDQVILPVRRELNEASSAPSPVNVPAEDAWPTWSECTSSRTASSAPT